MQTQPTKSIQPRPAVQSQTDRDAEVRKLVDRGELGPITDAELLALVTFAAAEIHDLDTQAATLEADAMHASARFKSAPSAETASNREVMAQQALNARAAHQAAITRHAPLQSENTRRKGIRRLEELRRNDLNSQIAPIADAVAKALEALRDLTQEQLGALAVVLEARNATASELADLERRYGVGGGTPARLHFAEGVDRLCEAVQSRVGSLAGLAHHQGSHLSYIEEDHIVRIQLRFQHQTLPRLR